MYELVLVLLITTPLVGIIVELSEIKREIKKLRKKE